MVIPTISVASVMAMMAVVSRIVGTSGVRSLIIALYREGLTPEVPASIRYDYLTSRCTSVIVSFCLSFNKGTASTLVGAQYWKLAPLGASSSPGSPGRTF